MLVLLILEITTLILMFLLSRGQFEDEKALAGIKTGGLNLFVPAALKLMALLKHKYDTMYERKICMKLRELYGDKNHQARMKLFMARKVVYLWLSLIFLTFTGLIVRIDETYAVFCAAVITLLFFAPDKQLDNAIKKRIRAFQLEFPEFLNKLVLLVNAGLTVRSAFVKTVTSSGKDSPLYKELSQVVNEITSGVPEPEAYENLAMRCRLQEISAFSTALMQNLRKGSNELVPILRLQANT